MKYIFGMLMAMNSYFIAEGQAKVMQKPASANTLAKKVKVSYTFKDTLIPVRLTRAGLNYFVKNKIDISTKVSNYLEQYRSGTVPINTNTVPDTNRTIVSEKILEDGGFETTYSDGSKKILYSNGFTVIDPQGRARKVSYIQVSTFAPPSAPNDPDVIKYLQNVSATLLSFLTDLLEQDAVSIANFQKGDANLNLYQVINRRFRFIDYVTSNK